ncbi:Hypothetical predicted protein [Olea europaea subsp. europaea]|uniref:Uncharacterized protein n=1 Tax=Olea europaea subsp. europaea TaxID=158383 RepID=A0A8S0RCN4_OLEEU|nr:Hypothetical predicted protein [Olea europaea subsp. europaea]
MQQQMQRWPISPTMNGLICISGVFGATKRPYRSHGPDPSSPPDIGDYDTTKPPRPRPTTSTTARPTTTTSTPPPKGKGPKGRKESPIRMMQRMASKAPGHVPFAQTQPPDRSLRIESLAILRTQERGKTQICDRRTPARLLRSVTKCFVSFCRVNANISAAIRTKCHERNSNGEIRAQSFGWPDKGKAKSGVRNSNLASPMGATKLETFSMSPDDVSSAPTGWLDRPRGASISPISLMENTHSEFARSSAPAPSPTGWRKSIPQVEKPHK